MKKTTDFSANLLPHTSYRLSYLAHLFLLSTFFLFPFILHAQRLEVHGIKDLSTDENAKKAWGVGGTIELDQIVNKMTFKIFFDWATYKPKENVIKLNYQRMSGGIVACYAIPINEKATFQCGAEISYSHLKNTFIYDYLLIDTIMKPLTLLQRGNFVGIGAHIGLLYKLSPRFNLALNIVPAYLISVGAKSSVKTIDPEYNKGIWMFPIRLGFSYQLFKED